ncbi:hypothetical protein Dsin_010398 [Dipteronia sinensis]|uniref:Uncharacterized protein n=1 Tax=Dipteronia sinensis TaxID=43782 RepID=A0AAE0ECJ0_9ROSI|nr:hypothetical protein Dsin_010398 [Dipteronia sinensis]
MTLTLRYPWTTALSSAFSDSFFRLMPPAIISISAHFLSMRIAKLTKRCSVSILLRAQRKTPRSSKRGEGKQGEGIQDVAETEPEKESTANVGMLPIDIVELLASREKTVILNDMPPPECLKNSLEFLKKRKTQAVNLDNLKLVSDEGWNQGKERLGDVTNDFLQENEKEAREDRGQNQKGRVRDRLTTKGVVSGVKKDSAVNVNQGHPMMEEEQATKVDFWKGVKNKGKEKWVRISKPRKLMNGCGGQDSLSSMDGQAEEGLFRWGGESSHKANKDGLGGNCAWALRGERPTKENDPVNSSRIEDPLRCSSLESPLMAHLNELEAAFVKANKKLGLIRNPISNRMESEDRRYGSVAVDSRSPSTHYVEASRDDVIETPTETELHAEEGRDTIADRSAEEVSVVEVSPVILSRKKRGNKGGLSSKIHGMKTRKTRNAKNRGGTAPKEDEEEDYRPTEAVVRNEDKQMTCSRK